MTIATESRASSSAATGDGLYKPDLATFRDLASGPANLIPVYREFAADLETPVSVYLKLMDSFGPSFLLESVEGGEQVGRYSFVGVAPRGMVALHGREVHRQRGDGEIAVRELEPGEDILDVLKAELGRFTPADVPGLPRFSGGAVGYLGYDVVRFFEKLPETAEAVVPIPDAIFLLADTLVVFDHVRHRLMIRQRAGGRRRGGGLCQAIQRIERVSERLLRRCRRCPSGGQPAAQRTGAAGLQRQPDALKRWWRAREHTPRATSSRWCSASGSAGAPTPTRSPSTGRCGC